MAGLIEDQLCGKRITVMKYITLKNRIQLLPELNCFKKYHVAYYMFISVQL